VPSASGELGTPPKSRPYLELSAGANYGGGVDEARVASTAMHLVTETLRLQSEVRACLVYWGLISTPL